MPTILFPLSFFTLLLVERFLPGRAQPAVPRWRLKASLFFLLGGLVNTQLPPLVHHVVPRGVFLHLSALPVPAQIAIAFGVTTFVAYWMHRLMHRVDGLWRWTHQLHHSAERVDLAGFAYTHPLEMVLNVTIGSIVGGLLGAAPVAAGIAGFAFFAFGLFLHLDLRTPRWLGYVVPRPEMHLIHHQRGVHAYNYGLPLWDILFGTFRNPADVEVDAGFWPGASRRVGAMLLGRDVSRPPPITTASAGSP